MAAQAHLLRFSPFSSPPSATNRRHSPLAVATSFPSFLAASFPSPSPNRSLSLSLPRASAHSLNLSGSGGDGSRGGGSSGGGGGGGEGSADGSDRSDNLGPLGFFINGWRSRVAADPQFPFKVLMEELVGVSACVLGDMASRPNFGLDELDFVFSTLVVGSILNFVLMYLLAPTAASAAASTALPGIFARCPPGHMFETGAYSLFERLGTFVYKGTVFGAVGFVAGLGGTALSNGLISARKMMDPKFETPNKPPPTVLNALTWAIHMGASSNFRYQTLNGLEFMLAKALPPTWFKVNVVALRCLNNVLGGVSFVVLARLTGSQKVEGAVEGKAEEKVKLIEDEPVPPVAEHEVGDLQSSDAQNLGSSK